MEIAATREVARLKCVATMAALCLAFVALSAPQSRATELPLISGTLLQEIPTLRSPGEAGGRFGEGIAISANGRTAIVSAPANGPAGSAWIYVRTGPSWSIQGPPLPGLGTPEPCVPEGAGEAEACRYGLAVALSADGNTALIGAPADDAGLGAARIYTRSGSTWSAGPVLSGVEESGVGHFGRSVALSGDGRTAIIGGAYDDHGTGAAWIFNRTEEGWTAGPVLRGGEESGAGYFGRSVALSFDGSTALIGGQWDNHGAGAAWVYTHSESGWAMQGPKLTPSTPDGEERFGHSVALSADGDTALIGAPNYAEKLGGAFVFERTAGTWSQQGSALQAATPIGPSRLGTSVAISGDGSLALTGGSFDDRGDGAAWEFTRAAQGWSELGETTIGSEAKTHAHLGATVAVSADASTALAGAPYFEGEAGGVWSLRENLSIAPAVAGVEPATGTTAGGTEVTIHGSGFQPGASVTIGSQAIEVEVLSETEIKARTTATAAGPAEVLVSDDEGTSSDGPSFTFEAPPPPVEPPSEPAAKISSNTPPAPEAKSGTLGETTVKLSLPQFDRTGNLAPVDGRVLVELPGTTTFVALSGLRQVPFGTIVDATNGRVTVTTIAANGKVQSIDFFGGAFKLLQSKNGQVIAVLTGGNFAVCPTARERAHRALARTATSRSHVVRKLWASGHGKYSTKGNYATGAVLGTRWLTVDRCDGTLIYVATDLVAVTNLVNHHHRRVKAHHSYFAAAP